MFTHPLLCPISVVLGCKFGCAFRKATRRGALVQIRSSNCKKHYLSDVLDLHGGLVLAQPLVCVYVCVCVCASRRLFPSAASSQDPRRADHGLPSSVSKPREEKVTKVKQTDDDDDDGGVIASKRRQNMRIGTGQFAARNLLGPFLRFDLNPDNGGHVTKVVRVVYSLLFK